MMEPNGVATPKGIPKRGTPKTVYADDDDDEKKEKSTQQRKQIEAMGDQKLREKVEKKLAPHNVIYCTRACYTYGMIQGG